MIHSLRGRLLAGIVAGMIILLSAFSVLIYSVIRHYMIGQFDTSLLSTAQMLAAVMEDEQYENSQADDDADRNKTKNNERLEFNLDVRMIPEFNRVSGAAYYQFQQPNGTIFLRSPTLTAEQRLETATVSEHPEYRQTLLPGNKIARMVGIWFVPHSGGRDREFEFTESENQMLGLTVARDATGLFEKLTLLKLLLGGGCFCIIVLSVGAPPIRPCGGYRRCECQHPAEPL